MHAAKRKHASITTCPAHISLAFFLWDIDKRCKTRSDAANTASDQVLYCLLTEVSFKIE